MIEPMETSVSTKEGASNAMNFGPLFIALAAFMWTLDFFSRGYLVETVQMSPTHIVTFEHVLIVIVLLPFLVKYLPKLNQFTRNEWIAITIIGGGASALATVSLTQGYSLNFFIYGPIVALSQQIQPVFAIGLAHILLKEKLPQYYYPLSGLAIIGVVMMYWPTINLLQPGQVAFATGLLAAFYGLSAAVLWGSGTVLGKYILVHSDTEVKYLEIANYRFFIGMIFLVVYSALFTPFAEGIALLGRLDVLGNLLFLALIPGLLSLILYYYGLKSTHASVATLFELAFPLSFLVLVPFLIRGAQIAPIQFIGAAILILSTTVLSYIYGKETDPEHIEEIFHADTETDSELYP